jgi:hypothetical protein
VKRESTAVVSGADAGVGRWPVARALRSGPTPAYTDNMSSNEAPAREDAPQSAAAFRSSMAGYTWGRVPAPAIAAFVRENGAVYSSEILDRLFLSETTLRRRRPELARLGIAFIENGRGSLYATAELARQLPSSCLPK